MSLRRKLKDIRFIQAFSSIRITVTCLFLLLLLTFAGTIDQVYNGLYHAQESFFHSWVFLLFGFLPMPGAQLVLWVMFINLVCVATTRFVYKLNHLGIVIIHLGLLSYFVAAFVTFVCVKETNITLREGEASNLASAYHDWELSVWEQKGDRRQVVAYELKNIKEGTRLKIDEFGFEVEVNHYFLNARAYKKKEPQGQIYLNASGIQALQSVSRVKEPEKNIPGGIFTLHGTDENTPVLLYGAETWPTPITKNKKAYFVQLRRAKLPMPFVLKLKDFRMEKHPNTEVARSYQSLVEIQNQNVKREVLISMNQPLRYKDFTIYQASYSIDAMGRELSTLAVVKNAGRLMPYFASLITFVGLVVHFLVMGVLRRKNA